jgi:hypothetical protein
VRSLDEWRRAEATALPTWVKPQLTKLVDQPPDGPRDHRGLREQVAPGAAPAIDESPVRS